MLIQNEGHTDLAWLLFISNQEVAANVQFAILFGVKPGGFFDVLVHRVFRDR